MTTQVTSTVLGTLANLTITGNISVRSITTSAGNLYTYQIYNTSSNVIVDTRWVNIAVNSSNIIATGGDKVYIGPTGGGAYLLVGGNVLGQAATFSSSQINGNETVTGYVNVTGNVLATGGIFNTLTVNGTTTVSGSNYLNVGGNLLAATATLGTTTVNGTALTVTGFINSTGNVLAATGIFSSMTVNGGFTTTGTATVSTLNSQGNVLATGGIFNSLTVNGTTTLSGSNYLNVGGNLLAATATLGTTTVNGTSLTVSGFINSTGNILSTGAIHNSLTVNGNTFISSLGVGTTTYGNVGEIRATNAITSYYSDERLKTRLGVIENALDKVDQLTGFYYEANDVAQVLGYTRQREVGVSAQATQAVLPEIVRAAPISDEYLTVQYERFAPLLIEAIKELRQEVNALKRQLGN